VSAFCAPVEVLVYVHSCPQRDQDRSYTLASLEASDARGLFHLERQPEACTPMAFHLQVLERCLQAVEAGRARLVVRIEDDAVVSPHLVHNVRTWPALMEEDFGVGWLFVPRYGVANPTSRGSLSGTTVWQSPRLCASLGQVWTAQGLTHFLQHYRARPEVLARAVKRQFVGTREANGFDITVSETVWAMGKRVYLHEPPLVDFSPAAQRSAFGNDPSPHLPTPMDPAFRRTV
jgi:hypothetical protein